MALQGAVAGLEAQGLLTEAEAASARPPIEVEVVDVRRRKTPLPRLALADASIKVTNRAVNPSD